MPRTHDGGSPSLEAEPTRKSNREGVPRRVGRYEVLARIASGGMGSVYWARASGPRGFIKDVALKLTHQHLLSEDGFGETLLHEAKLAARVQHLNVVEVLDLGDDPQGFFLVMEYVKGDSLAGILKILKERNEPMPIAIGGRILVDALHGLAAVHELVGDDGAPLGVIHRDFSPHNLMVGLDGVTKLTDFGVAKVRDRMIQTASGLVKGKVPYMSPEQARAHPLDQRSDVWSAGVVAWEVFANRRLFDASNDVELILKLVSDTPALLSEVGVSLPGALEAAVRDALVPERERRIATASALAERIAAAIPDLADHRAVGAYVAPLIEPKLRARLLESEQRRADEVAASERPSPASVPTVDARGKARELAHEEPARTRDPITRTTNIVTATDAVVLPKNPRWPVIAGASVLLVAAAAAGLIAARTRPSPTPDGVAAADESSASAPHAVASSAGPPAKVSATAEAPGAVSANASAAMSAAQPSAAGHESAPPKSSARPAGPSQGRATATATAKASAAPADDPFASPYR